MHFHNLTDAGNDIAKYTKLVYHDYCDRFICAHCLISIRSDIAESTKLVYHDYRDKLMHSITLRNV